MTSPLVSIVIIVRNGEKYLGSAIESVLAQEYRPIEIIIVDGQSTDRTAAIAQSYTEVRYVKQANAGVADAYNTGINAAQGEFIAFLSHDDIWVKDKLRTQVDYLVQHPGVQYTIGNVRFFLEAGAALPKGFQPHLLEGEHIGYIMETLLARKSVFKLVGDFDPDFRIANDTDWYARANDMRVPMAVHAKVLVLKRLHDSNTTADVERVHDDMLKVLRNSIARKRRQHDTAANAWAGDSSPKGMG